MRIRIDFTVEADYEKWVEDMKNLPNYAADVDLSRSRFRDNLKALAEEAFSNSMEDYVDVEYL